MDVCAPKGAPNQLVSKLNQFNTFDLLALFRNCYQSLINYHNVNPVMCLIE